MGASLIKKEAITGYEDLEIDLYQDKRLEEKKDLWFESCLHDLNWETGFIKIFGKTHQIPRLQAWYADNEIEYTYSGKKLRRHNWNKLLLEIKEKIMPELTDDWVSSVTEFDTVKEMNEELYKNIESVKKRQIANQYQGLLTSKLIEESKLELPEQLVIAEMDSILQNFMNELQQNNIKIEDYLQITGLTEETLQEDLKNQATRNLSMVVILDKVVEDQELKLDEKEVSFIDEHMSTHDGSEADSASHRLNLESESLRNKAMLHILQQGISVDKNGEKVYLQDVYNQEEDLGEEE